MVRSRWEAPARRPLQDGDRMFVPCHGGPCTSRLVFFPPALEIDERGGQYVLNDDGDPATWVYEFVPST